MNGARTIFRRKGYFFTALAAAVLLAASSGTAWAQDTVDPKVDIVSVTLAGGTTVNEGAEATAVVKFTVEAGSAAVEQTMATVKFAFNRDTDR